MTLGRDDRTSMRLALSDPEGEVPNADVVRSVFGPHLF